MTSVEVGPNKSIATKKLLFAMKAKQKKLLQGVIKSFWKI